MINIAKYDANVAADIAREKQAAHLEKLVDGIKRDVIATCARVAEIHHVKPVGKFLRGSYMDGYNTAVRDIAAKIRELQS